MVRPAIITLPSAPKIGHIFSGTLYQKMCIYHQLAKSWPKNGSRRKKSAPMSNWMNGSSCPTTCMRSWSSPTKSNPPPWRRPGGMWRRPGGVSLRRPHPKNGREIHWGQSSGNLKGNAPNAYGHKGTRILHGRPVFMIASFDLKKHCIRCDLILPQTQRIGTKIVIISRVCTRRDAPPGRLYVYKPGGAPLTSSATPPSATTARPAPPDTTPPHPQLTTQQRSRRLSRWGAQWSPTL